MDQLNAIVPLNVERLNFPLKTLYARVGHNLVVKFTNAPADCTALVLRLFKANGAYYDTSCSEHADGTWTARVLAACFGEVTTTKYEVHAVSSEDQPAALGEGVLDVATFSTSTTPLRPGTVQTVQQMPCEGGGTVQVVMKWDGYAWVQEAVYTASTNDDTTTT